MPKRSQNLVGAPPQRAHGDGVHMCWHRPSGSVASLQSTTPASCAAHGLGTTNVLAMLHAVALAVAEPYAEPAVLPAVQTPTASAPRMFLCPSACGSPRALGNVPLLQSEHFLYSRSPTFAEAGRRVRGSSACSDALQSFALEAEAEAEAAAAALASPLCRSESFGADSKFGFEEGAAVFAMDWDSDSGSEDSEEIEVA